MQDSAEIRPSKHFGEGDAQDAAAATGVDLTQKRYTAADLAKGMNVELEHGTAYPPTDITSDDRDTTAKIAEAHLHERADYYDRLPAAESAPGGRESELYARAHGHATGGRGAPAGS